MAGLEGIIRPFVGNNIGPQRYIPGQAASAPPVRLSVGVVGGSKSFGFSNSSSLSSYMAAVHTEKPSDAFDMSTGRLAQ